MSLHTALSRGGAPARQVQVSHQVGGRDRARMDRVAVMPSLPQRRVARRRIERWRSWTARKPVPRRTDGR